MTPRGGILRQGGAGATLSPEHDGLGVASPVAAGKFTRSNELDLEEFELPPEAPPMAGASQAELALHATWGAREQALRESWERERHAEAERAYQRGLAEGRAQAEAEGAHRIDSAAQALRTAVAQVRENDAKFTGALEENLAAISVAIARHIIGREVNTDPAAVAVLVRRAVAEFPLDQPLRIRVHPADLALLTTARGPEGEPLAVVGARDVTWLADPRLARGGSIVEGRERIVDGRVDEALERVFRRLGKVTA
ncbi:MAG: FliH/SctL family protein [Gemmatimonadaceae bacterium]